MAFGPYITATLNWSSASGSHNTILYYKPTDLVITQQNIVAVADFILAKLGTACRAVIPPYIKFNPIVVRTHGDGTDLEDTSSEASGAGTYTILQSELGLGENDVLPEGNQVVIQRRTGLAGRSKRGRVFIPYVPETFCDNSTLNAVGLPKYKTLAQKIAQSIEAGDNGETLDACTPDFKNQVMVHVTHARVVSEVLYRKDRREPKRPVYFKAPA